MRGSAKFSILILLFVFHVMLRHVWWRSVSMVCMYYVAYVFFFLNFILDGLETVQKSKVISFRLKMYLIVFLDTYFSLYILNVFEFNYVLRG